MRKGGSVRPAEIQIIGDEIVELPFLPLSGGGGGGGDIETPAASVDGEIVLFDGTTGDALKRATGSGLAKLVDGVLSTVTAPAGAVVGNSDSQTITGKRNQKRVISITYDAAPQANCSNCDIFDITAASGTVTFGLPIGTPVDTEMILYRIRDDGTSRTLAWNAIFRAGVASLPTETTVGKTTYVLVIHNATDNKWDCLAAGTTA